MKMIKDIVDQRTVSAQTNGAPSSSPTEGLTQPEGSIPETPPRLTLGRPASEQPVTRPARSSVQHDSPMPQPPKSVTPGPKVWDLPDDAQDDIPVERTRKPARRVISEPRLERANADGTPVIPKGPENSRPAGRVKTRLLGFESASTIGGNVFDRKEEPRAAAETDFPVGWLVVVKGPGRGKHFPLASGISFIGRGDGQTIRLDFGDDSISRKNHAAIAFDEEQNTCFLGHGGKANLVRKNGMPVLATEPLSNGDTIRVGETTLKFVELCGTTFNWDAPRDDGRNDGGH